jgi:hypothetical protein
MAILWEVTKYGTVILNILKQINYISKLTLQKIRIKFYLIWAKKTFLTIVQLEEGFMRIVS